MGISVCDNVDGASNLLSRFIFLLLLGLVLTSLLVMPQSPFILSFVSPSILSMTSSFAMVLIVPFGSSSGLVVIGSFHELG